LVLTTADIEMFDPETEGTGNRLRSLPLVPPPRAYSARAGIPSPSPSLVGVTVPKVEAKVGAGGAVIERVPVAEPW